MTPTRKQKKSDCDITYGTNREVGFDYLRDIGDDPLGGRGQRPVTSTVWSTKPDLLGM
ncbi:hypothetical protein [Scytonema sp. UIC 10036]|uniref:hypothetical protein n=1 Tax=Scytonema sp. UIC 10036 TaxID=2304196 RepID=UPI00242AFEFF|nr:hypothetical protein [Scytonema sp. UIC 10036]